MKAPKGQSRDLDRTRADILAVATEHFARMGFFGARIDEIAAATSTTKRMTYYCFGSKDGLFSACLNAAYGKIREFERTLDLDHLPPRDAISRYVRETVRYHDEHPELALLVRSENLLGAIHLKDSDSLQNRSIVATLDAVLERGVSSGEFRADATGVAVHVTVTALANYRITNEATIGVLFGFPTRDPARFDHDVDQYAAMILGWLGATTPSRPTASVGHSIRPEPAIPPVGSGNQQRKGSR